jgi:hypothetical protein
LRHRQADPHYCAAGDFQMTVVLKPVMREGFWCVKMTWRKKIPRYFGRFVDRADAEKWIEKHHWMTEQRQDFAKLPKLLRKE